MKKKEEFYKEIDIFSKGVEGFSPFIVDIMKAIEREYGGIDTEYLDYMSEKFRVNINEILDTAKLLQLKIYNNKETVEIRVCLGMNCKAKGGDFLFEEVKKILKIDVDEITEDGRFTLKIQRCFAKCNLGPNIKIGDKFYHEVQVEQIKKIIEENRKI